MNLLKKIAFRVPSINQKWEKVRKSKKERKEARLRKYLPQNNARALSQNREKYIFFAIITASGRSVISNILGSDNQSFVRRVVTLVCSVFPLAASYRARICRLKGCSGPELLAFWGHTTW